MHRRLPDAPLATVTGLSRRLAAELLGTAVLVATVVAVRQALDYPGTGRALAVCALGFPIYAAIQFTSLLLLGPWPV